MSDVPSIRRARLREKYGLGATGSSPGSSSTEAKKSALKNALAQAAQKTDDGHEQLVCVPQEPTADPEAISSVLKDADNCTKQFLQAILLLDRMTTVPECVLLGIDVPQISTLGWLW